MKKPEHIPPAEISAALTAVVESSIGISTEDAVSGVARLFGFKSTSAKLRGVIMDELQRLLDRDVIEERHGKLFGKKASV